MKKEKALSKNTKDMFELQNQFSKDSNIKMYLEMIRKIHEKSTVEARIINGNLKLTYPNNHQYVVDYCHEEINKIKAEKYSELFYK